MERRKTAQSHAEPRRTPHSKLELPQVFADLGFAEPFLKGLAKIGITTPTEIQSQMAPHALAGRDIVGQARTGTGKSIAFALPILQRMDPEGGLQALCLVPTRELATQVVEEIRKVAHYSKLRAAAIYGGQRVQMQLRALERVPHFIVGTPGRMIDMLDRKHIDIGGLKAVVLDEVDRMLDIGFRDDIRNILSRIKGKHQTILVSATIDSEIKKLIAKYTHEPVEINVSRDVITVDEVDQSYVLVDRHDKLAVLKLLLAQEKPDLAIIFTNTKGAARRLTERLNHAGYKAAELHGDLVQRQRDAVMKRFRESDVHLLVATDLAARGLDVSQITHIVNFDVPQDIEIYVHRIGRTARMGRRGTAITLVTRDEGPMLTAVEMLINREIPQRKFDGYEAPPLRPVVTPDAPPAGGTTAAGADGTSTPEPDAPPRALGGKHKPMRSRRLR